MDCSEGQVLNAPVCGVCFCRLPVVLIHEKCLPVLAFLVLVVSVLDRTGVVRNDDSEKAMVTGFTSIRMLRTLVLL